MVVHEEARCDVKGHKHVNGVVLVGGQNKKYAEDVTNPCKRVKEVDSPRSVLGDEKV